MQKFKHEVWEIRNTATKKKKKEKKKKKSHSTALYFKNHSADIGHTCKTIMFLRSKDLNKNLLPPILIVL